MHIGENIKKYRLEKKLKQSELAEKSKVSRVAIGNYERGDRMPSAKILHSIATALNVTVNDLIGTLDFFGSKQQILYEVSNHPYLSPDDKGNFLDLMIKNYGLDGIESYDLFVLLLSSLGYTDAKIDRDTAYLFKKIKAQIELEMIMLKEDKEGD